MKKDISKTTKTQKQGTERGSSFPGRALSSRWSAQNSEMNSNERTRKVGIPWTQKN